MITASQNIINEINSAVRRIQAKVEFFEDSTLVEVCHCNDKLKSFTVERVGDESKFFGFGICHRANIKLLDKFRELNISTANSFRITYIIAGEEIAPYPMFYVSEVRRQENDNSLSITAYDIMYPDSAHRVADLMLTAPYTVREFVQACSDCYGTDGFITTGLDSSETCFDTLILEGGNFDGSETVRDALNDVAEITQTIFYINNDNKLVFKRLDKDGDPIAIIDKSKYITLESSTNRRLVRVAHITELGDNAATPMMTGTTQYIRNNAFWMLRTDLDVLLENAIAAVRGLTINQFDCSWRGNPMLEVGDKIGLVAYDDKIVNSFILNDTIDYTGILQEITSWRYNDNEVETESTPISIGEALNQTFAKVDKVNKEISLVVKDTQDLSSSVNKLVVDASGILAEAKQVSQQTSSNIEGMNNAIDNISKRVQAAITADNLSIAIQTELENGVSSIQTKTGFTFDEVGLTIDKLGSEMTTTITEDGMTVYRDENEVLVANNVGVQAINLHAKTYLIVGNYSRFEDYENENKEPRTGCFWLGE